MNREARQKKASLVKKALVVMQSELKTASGQRKADLDFDMGMAQQDYDSLMDFDTYPDEYFDDSVFDESLTLPDQGDVLPESPMDELEMDAPGAGLPMDGFAEPEPYDAFIESMDAPVVSDQLLDGCGPVQSDDMWTATNRDHVSYILDKMADLTAAIEQYEHRAALANKNASSKSARKAVATHMKKLASVVHKADFAQEDTGKLLDLVGGEVMALHKQFGLSA